VIDLALYQPDIPQNAGAILRLAACLDAPAHVIQPAGFDLSDRRLRRAGMDYLALVDLTRHRDWPAFEAWRAEAGRRLVALTARGDTLLTRFAFRRGDVLLLGRESAGLPEAVHAAADARLRIPIRAEARSLNVALAAAIALYEALRQTGALPSADAPDRLGGGR
jgi:tRNA (cytidine/uridine-2'-O-)-methyltransferase